LDAALPGAANMSNKRIRTKFVIARLTEQEHAAITEIADKHGLSPGALIRQTLLNVPPGRGVRRPSVDTKLLAQVLAELGKIGSNINQIAYHLNAGRPGDVMDGSIEAALRELLEWRTALMQSLGYERSRKPPEE
jgi:Bacterial mobilisation protein (MobC)